MLYSFTSYSLPEADLDGLLNAAEKFGYDGIELRMGSGHRHGVEVESSADERREFRQRVEASTIQISCLGCSARFADPALVPESLELGRAVLEVARDLGVSRIRVFGGPLPAGLSEAEAFQNVTASLKSLAEPAGRVGVKVCIETHDDWSSPALMAEVMANVDNPSVRVLWDVMHPVRTEGSTMRGAFEQLSQWVDHVHVHDGMLRRDVLEFRPMGEGELNHREVLQVLLESNYRGYLSGEWLGWEPGEVHLPREIAWLREQEAELLVG